jgi:HAD superfamily hydrolase (TIGR01509 family)
VLKALIFDFDGLIMDTESPEVDGWRAIYAEYGQEFPLQVWIRDVVGSTAANFNPAAHLAAVTGVDLDQAALHARAFTNRLEKQSMLKALPGVNDYVKTARRLGLRLAVASSSEHAWVEGYLRQLGLFDDFNVLICREDVQRIKPEPDLFLAALKALKVRAYEALAFEDSPNGILSARRAGLRVVAVPNPITKHGTIEGASLVLTSLAKLPLEKLLKKIDSENHPED